MASTIAHVASARLAIALREGGSRDIFPRCGVAALREESIFETAKNHLQCMGQLSMETNDRFKLLYGPYKALHVRPGRFLTCEVVGKVKVGGVSEGPIPWPVKWRNCKSIIVCGDLVRAIRLESEQAIAHHWGVGLQTVSRWRAALGVTLTPGTHAILSQNAKEFVTPERLAEMGRRARTPRARAKIRASRLGRPLHPKLRAAFLAASKQPKSEKFKRILSEKTRKRVARGGVPFLSPEQIWTSKQIKLLGKKPDQEVARLLGRSVNAVSLKRQRLKIPAWMAEQPVEK